MTFSCRDQCRRDCNMRGMQHLNPATAYRSASRCTTCSDIGDDIWYLKIINKCPCCSSRLRTKSRHKKILN